MKKILLGVLLGIALAFAIGHFAGDGKKGCAEAEAEIERLEGLYDFDIVKFRALKDQFKQLDVSCQLDFLKAASSQRQDCLYGALNICASGWGR